MKNRVIAGLDVVEIPGDPGAATIIMLHGFGANAMDLVSLNEAFRLIPKPTWLFPNGPLEIPIMPGFNGRAWFPIDIEALQQGDFKSLITELPEARQRVERLVGELNIPRSKLILGGFSQGAVLAVETALHGMDPVAALLIFSGTLICEPDWRALSHLHAKTSFFQSHGIDDSLLPMNKAEDLAKLLQEGGLKGELHKFKGGHEIPRATLIQADKFLSNVLS